MKTNYQLGDVVRVTDSRNRKFYGRITNIVNGVLTVTFSNHKWKFCTPEQCEYFSPFKVWFWNSFPSPAKRFGVKVVLCIILTACVYSLVQLMAQ